MQDKIYHLIEMMIKAVIDKLAREAVPIVNADETYMAINEAADYLEVTPRTVARYKKSKFLVPYVFGGIDVYSLSDLKEYRYNRGR